MLLLSHDLICESSLLFQKALAIVEKGWFVSVMSVVFI